MGQEDMHRTYQAKWEKKYQIQGPQKNASNARFLSHAYQSPSPTPTTTTTHTHTFKHKQGKIVTASRQDSRSDSLIETTKIKQLNLFKQEPKEMSICFSTKELKSYRTSSPLLIYTAKIDKQTIETENIHSTEALTCWSAGLTKIKLHEATRDMCTSINDSRTP
jgi:hypothetical protein